MTSSSGDRRARLERPRYTTSAARAYIHFPNADPAAVPSTSSDGIAWQRYRCSRPELPAGQPDGYFRDSAGTVHVLTRHLTYFGLPARPFGALTMKIVNAKRVSLAVRKYVAVRVQVSAAARLSTWLVDSKGKSVNTWGKKNVKAGTTILRLALPTTLARSGAYRIQGRATGRGQTGGRTAKVLLLETPLTAPFTPKGEKVGIVVVKSDLIKNLKLDQRFTVRPVSGSQVLDATGLRSAFVEAVVIDLDRESVGPSLASARSSRADRGPLELPTAAACARRAGLDRDHEANSPELVAALVGQLIWR